jgi:hypothetical protein
MALFWRHLNPAICRSTHEHFAKSVNIQYHNTNKLAVTQPPRNIFHYCFADRELYENWRAYTCYQHPLNCKFVRFFNHEFAGTCCRPVDFLPSSCPGERERDAVKIPLPYIHLLYHGTLNLKRSVNQRRLYFGALSQYS